MRSIFSFIFDLVTDPLGLPIPAPWEFLILCAVGVISFKIAFSLVGDLRHIGVLQTSVGSSIVHWIIRIIAFIAIWAILYVLIATVKFVIAHWIMVLSILGGLLIAGITVFAVIRRKKAC